MDKIDKIDQDYLNEFDTDIIYFDDSGFDDEEIEYSNFDSKIITIENGIETEELLNDKIDQDYFNIIYNFEQCIKKQENIIDLNETLCGTVFYINKEISYYLFEEEVNSNNNEFIFLFEDNNDYIFYEDKSSKILISRERFLCEKYITINNEYFNDNEYLNKLKNIIIVYNFEIDRKKKSLEEAILNMEKNIEFMRDN